MTFELHNVLVQPDRLAEIKLEADFIQCPKNLVGTGVAGVIRNTGIPEHMIILKGSCPQAKHKFSSHSEYMFLSYRISNAGASTNVFLKGLRKWN